MRDERGLNGIDLRTCHRTSNPLTIEVESIGDKVNNSFGMNKNQVLI